jgi:hypothetical protein
LASVVDANGVGNELSCGRSDQCVQIRQFAIGENGRALFPGVVIAHRDKKLRTPNDHAIIIDCLGLKFFDPPASAENE